MKTIVIGYDGSEHAQRALDRSVELLDPDGKIIVVVALPVLSDPRPTLVPHEALAEHPDLVVLDEAHVRERDRVLAEARDRLTNSGIQVEVEEAPHGDPAHAIVEAGRLADADLIVVGTRGRNLLERFLLGSVSTKVVHHADRDVLVVR